MSCRRMQARVPSAEQLLKAELCGYRLRFHKSGADSSAKADAHYTGIKADRVLGVVYQIDPTEKHHLDRAEGAGIGYECVDVQLILEDGTQQNAFAYVALHIDRGMRPFHWYKQHVLQGAIEAGLPETYIAQIHDVASIDDADVERHQREMSIYLS